MESSPPSPQPLSTIGRLRAALRSRLVELGHEILEEHPDHLVVRIAGQPHSIYLGNLSRALELGLQVQQAQPGQPGQPGQEGTSEPAGLEPDQIRKAVEDWLAVHLQQLPSRQSLEEQFATLAAAQPSLLPRLVPPASPGQPGQRWTRPLCPGHIELALVLDQPEIVTFVTPQMVAQWGAQASEEAAMANLGRLAEPADFRPFNETGRLLLCATSDTYAASRVLRAETLVTVDESSGLLAGLPSRDVLFVAPLTGRSLEDLPFLAMLTRKTVGELPYPLSGEIFWIRGRRWRHIPVRIAEGEMNVDSPEEFAEVIQRLMDDEVTGQGG